MSLRISHRGPDGKQHQLALRIALYTPEETAYIQREFKEWIRLGNSEKDFMLTRRIPPELMAKPVLDGEKAHFRHSSLQQDIDIPDNNCSSWAIIGSTRSGKSVAMKYIYEKYFKKDHIPILMTLSGQADIYDDFKKSAVICEGFRKEMILEPMAINRATKNAHEFLVIVDDLTDHGKMSDSMTRLLCVGRNQGMSAIIAGQRMTMLSATGRTNINFVMCFWLNTDSDIINTIKTFLKSYFPKGCTMDEMVAIYREMTKDHHYIMYDTLKGAIWRGKIDM